MNGHAAVIASRLAGQAPAALWFEFGVPGRFDDYLANTHRIVIEDTDTPSRLDFRFAHGLPVHISVGDLTPRVEQLISRVRHFKPADLFIHYAHGLLHYGDELTEVI